jgi:prevent-host-death family protein
MHMVNVYEAKTHLSKLLCEVEQGEEVIIGKAGKPLARLIPYEKNRVERKPGLWAGKIIMADDFDELPQDIMDAFEGK